MFWSTRKVIVFRDIYLYLNCSKFLLLLGFISSKWAAFSFLLRLCIEWLFKPKLLLIKLSHSIQLVVFCSYFHFRSKFPTMWFQSPHWAWQIKAIIFEVLVAAQKMTIEGSFIQPAIPRFDGHYDHWRMLMENFYNLMNFGGWWSLAILSQQVNWCRQMHSKRRMMRWS